MNIPYNFFQNLNEASLSVHHELTDQQVQTAQELWPQASHESDAYLLIIQGLMLLSDLNAKNVGDKNFQRGFELLKQLSPGELKRNEAHQKIAFQVLHQNRIEKANREAEGALSDFKKTWKNAESFAPEEMERIMEEAYKSINKMGALLRQFRGGVAFLEKHEEVENRQGKLVDYQKKMDALQSGPWLFVKKCLLEAAHATVRASTLPPEFEEMDQGVKQFNQWLDKKLKSDNFNRAEPEVEVDEPAQPWIPVDPERQMRTREKNLEAIGSIQDAAARAKLAGLLDSDINQFFQEGIKACPKPLFLGGEGGKLTAVITDPMKHELKRLNRARDDVRQKGLKSEELKELTRTLDDLEGEALKAKMAEIQQRWLQVGSGREWFYDGMGVLKQRSDRWLQKNLAIFEHGDNAPVLWQETRWEVKWKRFWGS